jgi:hypothetical protein
MPTPSAGCGPVVVSSITGVQSWRTRWCAARGAVPAGETANAGGGRPAAPGRSVSRRVTVRTFLVWGPRAGLPHWRGAGRRPGRKRQARACPWLGCVRWLCVRTGRAHDFSFECTPSAIHGRFHRWVRGRHATRAWPGRLGALGAGEPVGRPAGDVVPGRFAGTHTFSGLIRFHRVDSDRN